MTKLPAPRGQTLYPNRPSNLFPHITYTAVPRRPAKGDEEPQDQDAPSVRDRLRSRPKQRRGEGYPQERGAGVAAPRHEITRKTTSAWRAERADSAEALQSGPQSENYGTFGNQ